jgi:hypothetical protein
MLLYSTNLYASLRLARQGGAHIGRFHIDVEKAWRPVERFSTPNSCHPLQECLESPPRS